MRPDIVVLEPVRSVHGSQRETRAAGYARHPIELLSRAYTKGFLAQTLQALHWRVPPRRKSAARWAELQRLALAVLHQQAFSSRPTLSGQHFSREQDQREARPGR